MIEGVIDGQVLELYIRHFLAPQLRPGDIVIWDDAQMRNPECSNRKRFNTTVVVALVSPEYAYSVSVLLAPDVSFAISTNSQPAPGLVAFPTPTTRSVVVLPVSLAG
jgi:hypothetical protein